MEYFFDSIHKSIIKFLSDWIASSQSKKIISRITRKSIEEDHSIPIINTEEIEKVIKYGSHFDPHYANLLIKRYGFKINQKNAK